MKGGTPVTDEEDEGPRGGRYLPGMDWAGGAPEPMSEIPAEPPKSQQDPPKSSPPPVRSPTLGGAFIEGQVAKFLHFRGTAGGKAPPSPGLFSFGKKNPKPARLRSVHGAAAAACKTLVSLFLGYFCTFAFHFFLTTLTKVPRRW